MAEPLCTFKLYEEFKKLSNKNIIILKMEELNDEAIPFAKEIFSQMDLFLWNCWKFFLHFMLLLISNE
jgi:hypothetical protein